MESPPGYNRTAGWRRWFGGRYAGTQCRAGNRENVCRAGVLLPRRESLGHIRTATVRHRRIQTQTTSLENSPMYSDAAVSKDDSHGARVANECIVEGMVKSLHRGLFVA